MISYIRGPLVEIDEDMIVVEAGAVGYNIRVPLSVREGLPAVGKEVRIYTYLQVREDAMALYGFLSRQDLNMFRMLLTVNGIGAKAALSVMSTLRLPDLQAAILSEDGRAIARAPGVGPKTAKRVILDLKDKIRAEDLLPGAAAVSGDIQVQAVQGSLAADGAAREAVEALVALGYSSAEASRAVGRVAVTEEMTAEAVLKASLKYLAF